MSNEKNWPEKVIQYFPNEETDPVEVEYTRTDLLTEQDNQILEALETNLLWAEVDQDRDQIEAAIKILSERLK